jgi:hypothetical protein
MPDRLVRCVPNSWRRIRTTNTERRVGARLFGALTGPLSPVWPLGWSSILYIHASALLSRMYSFAALRNVPGLPSASVLSALGAWFPTPPTRTLIAERGRPSGGSRARSRLIERTPGRVGSGRGWPRCGRYARGGGAAGVAGLGCGFRRSRSAALMVVGRCRVAGGPRLMPADRRPARRGREPAGGPAGCSAGQA